MNQEKLAADLNQKAESYLAQGKLKEADATCNKALEKLEDLVLVFNTKARVLEAMGNQELAQEYYQKVILLTQRSAIAINPNLVEAHFNLANLFAQQQQWQAAIDSYNQAIELNPNQAEIYHKLGEALLELKKWEEAINVYHKAIEINPTFSWSYHKLGEALLELKKWEEAINAYHKAIEINPTFPWSYHKLGEALIQLKQWEDVVITYRYFIQLKPDFYLAHKNLGDALIKLERWSEAVEIYQTAIEMRPNFYWYQYYLGNCFFQLSKYDEAIAAYQRAIEIDPKLYFAHYNLGNTFLQLKRWNKAITAYGRAIEINPKSDWSYYNLAEALTKLEKWSEAIAVYQQAITHKPTPELYKKLGDVQQILGQLKAAVTNYQKALEITPQSFWNYAALVNVYMWQEKWLEARKCFQKAVQIKADYDCFGIKRASVKEKAIALTYDDGPNPPYTNQIINILDGYEARATFFTLGNKIQKHQRLAKLILAKGNELANHSYSHLDLSLESPESIRAEITKTDQLLRQLGVTEKIRFRPPFGHSAFHLIDMLLEMEKQLILWDIDSKDYVKEKDSVTIANRVIENARPGAIVLMHDISIKTVEATEIIIRNLTAQGYTFKTISEILSE
ncbi:MAG: tetratricopeptide repeat protein [Microcoleaceae cyanobacterium]